MTKTVNDAVQTLLAKITNASTTAQDQTNLTAALSTLLNNANFEKAIVAVAEQHINAAVTALNAAKTQVEQASAKVQAREVGELIQTVLNTHGSRKLLPCDGSLPDFSKFPALQSKLPAREKLVKSARALATTLTSSGHPHNQQLYRAKNICTTADGSRSFLTDFASGGKVYEVKHNNVNGDGQLNTIYTVSDAPTSGNTYLCSTCCSDDGQHIYVLSLKHDTVNSKFSTTASVYHSHDGGRTFNKSVIGNTPAWTGYSGVYAHSPEVHGYMQCSADGQKLEVMLLTHNSIEKVFCARSTNAAATFSISRTPFVNLKDPRNVIHSYVARDMRMALVANAKSVAEGQVYVSTAPEQPFKDVSAKMHYPIQRGHSWFLAADDSSTVLHVTQSNLDQQNGNVCWEYSRDNGTSFKKMSAVFSVPQAGNDVYIGAVRFDPENADYVYMAVANYTDNRQQVFALYKLNIITGESVCINSSALLSGEGASYLRHRFDVKRNGKNMSMAMGILTGGYHMYQWQFAIDKYLPTMPGTKIIAE